MTGNDEETTERREEDRLQKEQERELEELQKQAADELRAMYGVQHAEIIPLDTEEEVIFVNRCRINVAES